MTAGSSGAPSRPAPLYASLYVPDFPVAALQRGERRPQPTVVAHGESPNRFVCSADASARGRGVRDGMALAAAKARYDAAGASRSLRVFDRDKREERRSQALLLALAEKATPRFEDVAPGLLSLDFGGLRNPYAAAAKLASGASRLGFRASVGVSANRFVALCAARTQKGVTHVYPGQEAGFLQALPLDTLPLDRKDLGTLERWGVRDIGELARLPQEQLAQRFGERGTRMARLARGEEGSLLQPYRPPPQLELARDFDWEIERLEPLSLALSGLLDRLCLRLQGIGWAAASLTARLSLTDGGMFERTIDLPYPISDARTLLTLVRIDLEAHPPGGAVDGVRLSAKPAERRLVQQSLFAADLPSPEHLAVTLARLTGLVGHEQVGAPTVLDTHRPGAAALDAFRPAIDGTAAGCGSRPGPAPAAVGKGPAPTTRPDPSRERCQNPPALLAPSPPRTSLTFRAFRPSRPADVLVDQDRPVRVEAGEARGPVTASAGPWRVSGEWWTADGWQYQEWDVEVGGRLFRACCERPTGEWFLAGEYD